MEIKSSKVETGQSTGTVSPLRYIQIEAQITGW